MARTLRLSVLLLVVLFSGCLSDAPFVPNIEDTAFAPQLGVDLESSTKTASGLYYRDVTVGVGALVPATGNFSATTPYALYLRSGVLVEEGTFAFAVPGGAIAGYVEGVRGMRVGGRRQLIVPPHLGYGSARNGDIPANSILVFTVDLTSIN